MEIEIESVIRFSEVGVGDCGSGVKFRSKVHMEEDIEDVDDAGSCALDMDVRYLSPPETIHTTHTVVGSNEIAVVVEEPKEGMVFQCWQQVEAYYKDYAEQMGFGVKRAQGVNSKTGDPKKIKVTWKCECWGKPDMRARREAKKRAKAMSHGGSGGLVDGVVCEDELSGMKRTWKKCECQARAYAKVNEDGLWELKSVELKHNHAIDPENYKLVKEYRMRKMTCKAKKTLTDLYEHGVPISQIHGFMATERKGNMDLTLKDLQHEVYKARRLKMVGGDSVEMMEYFDKMQTKNQNFFHAQRLDKEGRLKDVLWVDARSRVAYEDFGDAVCFDATYLTNEYKLPFANFVGVNHHGQSLLLGCALVSHEDCNTFAWIFRQ
ncbi:protein FAR1-RELATED SEQUENCE 8-like [Chenopodium quinoa]|uniref:protein FAR1-RELATED SEQUENCE 8-like n=1 Tax=Chenopodium quinoa TaxID=63459 RepID=UPI000B78CFA4|nr:protein FAR1-RELATED SEQUENCE 8-like [Chenopodium quinoa]